MVLQAMEAVGGKGLGGSDAVRREARERCIVGLAVVHQDLALAADAQVLVGGLRSVVHRDECDVGIGQGFGGLPVRRALSVFASAEIQNRDRHLHPGADVEVTRRNLLGAEEDVAAVATGAGDLERVLAAVGGRAVKRDSPALVAVRSINRPCGLIPSFLEIRGDLSEGEWEERKRCCGREVVHDCCEV